jgi:hypothetical protein
MKQRNVGEFAIVGDELSRQTIGRMILSGGVRRDQQKGGSKNDDINYPEESFPNGSRIVSSDRRAPVLGRSNVKVQKVLVSHSLACFQVAVAEDGHTPHRGRGQNLAL